MKVYVDTENNEIAIEASPSEAAYFIRDLFDNKNRLDDEDWFSEFLIHNPVDYH